MADQNNGVARRRILQGAAWATPAIMIATAAPAAATSTVYTYPNVLASVRSGSSRISGTVTLSLPAEAPSLSIVEVVATVLKLPKTNGNTYEDVTASTTSADWTVIVTNTPTSSQVAEVRFRYTGGTFTATTVTQLTWTIANYNAAASTAPISGLHVEGNALPGNTYFTTGTFI